MKHPVRWAFMCLTLAVFLLLAFAPPPQAEDASPPDHVVKLIFVHHSTGENWLRDDYGNLGRVFGENNYFVSDTNYGWGPNSIGDRTDIPNWTEWFASGDTDIYMDALFNESSQNSSYTRTLSDPGGENEIIIFKSCFPNSALEGNLDDPPGNYEELSVSGAKYVYNRILSYFATRPDKLFVVITTPPLSDPTYSDNARAFNQWLMNDWLPENNYASNNVAVFDFYNVLTGPEAHHRFDNGQVEYALGERNTLYYPSGDDHPSEQGSRKATEEFVPLLNVFYHRWQASSPPLSIPNATTESQEEIPPEETLGADLIDDFDLHGLSGLSGWQGYFDESTSSALTCEVETGTGRSGNSLRLDFDIAANSWGTCALMLNAPQDWSTAEGLSFYFRAGQGGLLFDVNLYTGPGDNRATYLYTIEAPPWSVDDWIPMELRWEDFHRASWEENAGASFTESDPVSGLAIGLGTLEDAPNIGEIWLDDLQLLGAPAAANDTQAEDSQANSTIDAQSGESDGVQTGGRGLLPCSGAVAVPLIFTGMVLVRNRKRKRNFSGA